MDIVISNFFKKTFKIINKMKIKGLRKFAIAWLYFALLASYSLFCLSCV